MCRLPKPALRRGGRIVERKKIHACDVMTCRHTVIYCEKIIITSFVIMGSRDFVQIIGSYLKLLFRT